MVNLLDRIYDIDKNIFKNLESPNIKNDRGFYSTNILNELRNLAEHTALYIWQKDDKTIEFNKDNILKAPKQMSNIRNCKFIYKFHEILQVSVSHYTNSEDFSERLMLKYHKYLLQLKKLFKEEYDIELLKNLNKFPTNLDKNLREYYEKILEKLNGFELSNQENKENLYIQKNKPVIIDNEIFYELTLTPANDKISKTDRIIAFSKFEIESNYAIKATLFDTTIFMLDRYMPITIILDYKIAIRPCEFENFAKIFTGRKEYFGNKLECKKINSYLKENNVSLLDIVLYNDINYQEFKSLISIDKGKQIEINFLDVLDECRKMIFRNRDRANILRYLLFKMNNSIIKKQIHNEKNNKLSNLYLKYECIPFDTQPFVKNPPKHIPKFYDLLECINFNDKEEEFLARCITNNVETNGKLYTKTEELENFTNLDLLIAKYNSKLYINHKDSEIKCWNGNYYIKSYEDDTIYIINKLKELSQHGMDDYENIANNWLDFNQCDSDSRRIDDECKKDIIRKLFSKSSVALIYGAAGTGKSTLIKYISELFNDKNRIYIAQTNPAVQNIEKKVELAKNLTQTITKFLKNPTECDILFIDECSTISNKTMKEILEKANFKQLILIGDNFQIESIQYGSWFDIARNFITEKNGAIFELTTPYRTKDKELLAYWQEVRNIKKDEENKIIELDSHAKFSKPLNDEIFKEPADDEVILCLNYDGLYGVNNINKFLQIMNKNELVKFGIYGFKVGDPILFMENNYFVSNLHNNLKGKIKKIEKRTDDSDNIHEIYFEVEVERTFDSSSLTYGLTLLEQYENSSLVGFSVDTFTDNESDNEDARTIPFQLGYAVSIHKSQGLEFKSVKIIITNEIEEKISHNIFYTAITRAKEKLTIFWSPEVMNRVIENFAIKNNKVDLSILRTKNNI